MFQTYSPLVADIEAYITSELLVNETRPNGITDWSAFIGKGPDSYDLGYSPDEANSNYAHILVNVSDFIYNSEMINSLDAYCFEDYSA